MKNVFDILPGPIKKAVDKARFVEPTPIQSEAIPLIAKGSDILGIAQTGTGKTAAFVLPILSHLLVNPRKGVRALILCPTRELAMQVGREIQLFAENTDIRYAAIYGGVKQGPQVNALKTGANILVATPGRLMDLKEQGFVKLGLVEFFVLDEADRMLDMGFIHDIKKISSFVPTKRQTLFFSATMSGVVSQLANSLLRNPVRVEVTPQATPVEKIDQKVLFVNKEKKIDLLLHLLEQENLEKVLIFTKTKRGADKLSRVLKKSDVSAQQIHGDRTQKQRTQALKLFSTGKVRCLVATDVAARGIDIDDISHVINFDLPMEPENYVHRIGRTARAGAYGTAYSFSTTEDKILLNAIQKSIGAHIPVMEHEFHSEKAKNSVAKKIVRGPRGKKPYSRGQKRQTPGSTRDPGKKTGGQRFGRKKTSSRRPQKYNNRRTRR